MELSFLCLLFLCAILLPCENAESDIVKNIQYANDCNIDGVDSVKLVAYTNKRTNGTFIYKYALSDGTSHQTNGSIKEVNGTNLITVQGRYKWELGDGIYIIILYEADENGFRITQTQTYSEDRIIDSKSVGSLLG